MSAQDPAAVPAPHQDAPDRSPEELRADIEQTREDLGDTVESLAAKSDVKARAKGRVDEVKANVTQKVKGGGASSDPGAADGAASGPQQLATQALDTAKRNPLPVAAVGGALLGFLLGRAGR